MGQWKVMFVVRQPGFAETLKRIPFFGFKTRRRMWNRWSFFSIADYGQEEETDKALRIRFNKSVAGSGKFDKKMRCMVLFTGFLWWMVCQ